jgi:polyisoprenoid-binding protein YceI
MRLFVLALLLSSPAYGKPVGTAAFHAIGEGLALDINGEGAKVDLSSGAYSVKLSEFKTGIALRDTHLCKALECDKYPKAVFTIDPAFVMKDGDNTFKGTMELHGVKKPFSGQATIKGNKVFAIARLKLTDFGITPPDYKAAKVNNEVDITIDLAL